MDGGGRRVGYEYNYRFSIDNDMLSNTKDYILYRGVKNIIFDIRTNFIVKTNKTTIRDSNNDDNDDDDYQDEVIGSEKFCVVALKEGDDEYIIMFVHSWGRLEDYWMTLNEALRLCRDAVGFGQSQPSDLDPVPVAVGLDVYTVQQVGETIEATRERAITSKRLVPVYLWPFTFTVKENNKPPWLINFLRNLKRIRVLNIEQGLQTMGVCSICSKGPAIGAQISCLGTYGHAFHSHCIVGFLEHDSLCPTCRFPAYDP